MAEIEGSLADLEGCGLRRPRFFAYPHGESDRKVERAVEAAGFRAAFTVAPGLVRPGQDASRLPRIEILRGDQGWKYLYKVFAARSPAPGSGRLRPLVGHPWRRAARALPRQLRRARPVQTGSLSGPASCWCGSHKPDALPNAVACSCHKRAKLPWLFKSSLGRPCSTRRPWLRTIT